VDVDLTEIAAFESYNCLLSKIILSMSIIFYYLLYHIVM